MSISHHLYTYEISGFGCFCREPVSPRPKTNSENQKRIQQGGAKKSKALVTLPFVDFAPGATLWEDIKVLSAMSTLTTKPQIRPTPTINAIHTENSQGSDITFLFEKRTIARGSTRMGLQQKMYSGFEAGSNLGFVDVVFHSTLGLRVIQKKKKECNNANLTAVVRTLSDSERLIFHTVRFDAII